MVQLKKTLALCGGVPVCKEILASPKWPPINEATADRLRDVYLSGMWSFNSPAEQAFQKAFAEYHGAKHGIFMSNGTTTLEAALTVCGIGNGDEVIVPALTWMATAMAVHYVGATPVFVDVEPTTFCIDSEKVKAAITPKTRAIIAVHLYGSMADLEALQLIAAKHDLELIEDCAHMHGGKWNGKGVGSWGKIGSFSFQQSKTLSSGEGGICLTNDDEIAEKLFCYKHIGYRRDTAQGGSQQGPPEGLCCHNYRSTAFEATILLDQLAELEKRIEKYNESVLCLANRLAGVDGVRIQSPGRLASPQGYYGLLIAFDKGPIASISKKLIAEAAAAEGLPLVGTYGPVYKHILYNMPSDKYRIAGEPCTVADFTAVERTFCLYHQWLGADNKIIDMMGNIIEKIVTNADTLAMLNRK